MWDQVVDAAMSYAALHPGTLVISVSDHETGGLGLGIGPYQLQPAALANVTRSSNVIAGTMQQGTSVTDAMQRYAGIALTPNELAAITAQLNATQSKLAAAISDVLSKR